ncbi:MAG: alpha/beta hydrolase [Pseudomonadota bacterium]
MPDYINLSLPKKVSYIVKDKLKIVGDAYGSLDNPAVILAHGGGQTRHAWGNTASILAEQGWYAITLDLRGHGESEWHPHGDYDIGTFAEDLRIIASEFTQPPAFIGASLGGLSGLVAEGESQFSVFSSIIFVDIAHRYEKEGSERVVSFLGEYMEDGFASLEEASEAIAAYLPHRSKQNDITNLQKYLRFGSDDRYYWHWDPQFLIYNAKMLYTNITRFTAAALNLRIPTLLVRGLMSDVISKDVAMEFLDLVPHAKFADVEDAGHMVAGDQNDIFSDAIISFLRSLKY